MDHLTDLISTLNHASLISTKMINASLQHQPDPDRRRRIDRLLSVRKHLASALTDARLCSVSPDSGTQQMDLPQ